MNDLMIPEAAEVPAYLINKEQAQAAYDELTHGISSGYPPQLKLSGKSFKLVDSSGNETPVKAKQMVEGPDENMYLPVIILRARRDMQKAWYAKAYNPNDEVHSAPDCFSNDGVTPDPTSPAKQCGTCAACPHNQYGSGKDAAGNATKGKACRDTRINAVYVPKFGIYKLSIPPASFKNLERYAKELKVRGISPGNVKTLIGFDQQSDYAILTFAFGGWVKEGHLSMLAEMASSPEAEEIANDKIVASAQLPAPEPKKEAKAKPQPMVEEPADDLGLDDLGPAPAPVKQEAKAKPEPAPEPEVETSDDDLASELGLDDL
jgi:hypothetical protein